MTTDKILKRLQIEFLVFWVVCILFAALNELEVLPNGFYAGNGNMEYYLETIGIFMTLAFVPAALKLMPYILPKKILPVEDATARLTKYLLWSEVRLSLLFVGTMVNLTIYYLTMNNVGGLCALITLTASLFIRPAKGRIEDELAKGDVKKEKPATEMQEKVDTGKDKSKKDEPEMDHLGKDELGTKE